MERAALIGLEAPAGATEEIITSQRMRIRQLPILVRPRESGQKSFQPTSHCFAQDHSRLSATPWPADTSY